VAASWSASSWPMIVRRRRSFHGRCDTVRPSNSCKSAAFAALGSVNSNVRRALHLGHHALLTHHLRAVAQDSYRLIHLVLVHARSVARD
jgi:hypothetical protein